jgi:hypothetical protein
LQVTVLLPGTTKNLYYPRQSGIGVASEVYRLKSFHMLTKRDLVRSAALVAMSAAATKSDARQRHHLPPRLGFALIFPAKIVTKYALGPGEEQVWASFAIANTGSFPFDPSAVEISSQIGNNNLPGPARLVFVSESGSFTLNPGELSGDTFGLSLAAIQSKIPQVTSELSVYIRLTAYFINTRADSDRFHAYPACLK